MKILVCIAKTPDTTAKIKFKNDNTEFDGEGVQFIINPNDEFALARALEIKEDKGGSVTVISVDRSDADPVIRKALAVGADDAIRVDADPTDAFFVARQLAHYAGEGGYDLILLGRDTIDYNGGQVGGMVAEFMGLPFVPAVLNLDVEGDNMVAEREIAGGTQKVKTGMPMLASAMEGLAEWRIPNMRGIMTARKKSLDVKEPVDGDKLTSVKSYELPPPKGECTYVDAEEPEKLVQLLHEEAKVI